MKNFFVKERAQIQFRGEFFNAFNNVNYSGPGTTLGTASFGKIFGAGASRLVQFGLKVLF